jgi:DNA polymerase III subunit beta
MSEGSVMTKKQENTFSIDQKTLLALLSSMQPICTKRTTLDTTSSIFFQIGNKELVLKATDLEISLQASCMIQESTVTDPRSFLVSGKRIFDIVKELEGTVHCAFKNNQLIVTAGKVTLVLNSKDAQEFPPFPERIENLMHIDASFLLELMNKVAFLIPQNNANPALNGLFLELSQDGLRMTTTDGHCLAQVVTKKYVLPQEKRWLLPRRAIIELKKILEAIDDAIIFFGLCGNQLVFSGESFNFFTKLLQDSFPEYRPILQKNGFLAATIDRSSFVKTLRRSACLLSGQFLATQFGFEAEQLDVAIDNKEVGTLKEILAVEGYHGARLDIRFYSPYLLSGLQAFVDQDLKFYLQGSSKPIIFESEQNEYHMLYLVMPVSPTNQP